MKVSYYPGCSLEETAKPYDISVREVCRRLEVELEDIPSWSCCGSSPALKMDGLLSTSLGAHNLALAQQLPSSQVVVPCPFCFRRLLSAKEELTENQSLKAKVEKAIEAELEDRIDVHNLLGFLRHEIGLKAIRKNVRQPLSGLKVLSYYGCYLVKPAGVTHYDDPENPVSMDEVLEALGAEVLNWDFKTECCGAGLSISKTDTVCELTGRLIREAIWRGADALVVACQLCQANLDMRQAEIGRKNKRSYGIPILYFTQLMGLAFGITHKALGLHHHLISPKKLLKEKGWL